MPTVADLLALSRAAHQRYRAFLPTDMTLARDALRDAKRLRMQAEQADPHHLDAVWRQEPDHYQLVTFYNQQVPDA